MSDADGLLFSCLLDGKGGGTFGGWELVREHRPDQGLLWVHLDRDDPDARAWILRESGLDEIASTALLAADSRPRSLVRGEGLLVDLRGVNLNPGAVPDDMISMRAFVEANRIITMRRRHLKAIRDVKAQLEEATGPKDAGSFIVALASALDSRMADSMDELDERVDGLDERIMSEAGAGLRAEIGDLRRQIIALRRYLAPQREAVARLQSEKVPWLTDGHRAHLREVADRTMRRLEDLDSARERAGVAHEEFAGRMAEEMNRTMYVLAIVAAIFLPLGLLTGLLGINVGGIPGTEDDAAFWVVCGFLVLVAAAQIWVFKRKHWL